MHCPHFTDENGAHGTRLAFVPVKDAPSQMTLPDGITGRFIGTLANEPLGAPVRPSQRQRARTRTTEL
jgi:hypothetical protein